jgi:hypothetical protein
MAQELRLDQDVFASCSMRTNQMENLNAGLSQLHLRASNYNKRHDLFRAQLDHREAEVHRIHSELRGKPVKKKSWKRYDDAFKLYEMALVRMQEWNEHGEQLQIEYQRVIYEVKSLQTRINDECGGKWEPAIINKFCDDDSGRHDAFCKVFEE